MTKRVVSKHTKLLFIAFGALGIAAVAIVYAPDVERLLGLRPQVHRSVSVKPITGS